MKYVFSAQAMAEIPSETVICFAEQFDKIADKTLVEIDGATAGAVATLLKAKEFTGRAGEAVTLYRPSGFRCRRVVLLGLGDRKKKTADSYRKAMGTASRMTSIMSSGSAAVYFGTQRSESVYQAAVEGYLLGAFRILDYKTGENKRAKHRLNELQFVLAGKANLRRLEKSVRRGAIIAEGQMLARELTLTPSNLLTPELYADKVERLAKENKIQCRVLDQKAIEREKMGAFLSVARGSEAPPRFIVLQYKGGPAGQKPIVLVGKGVTFDSGGISLKPSLDMHEMKQDMAGSAVVVATVITASRLRINRNIVGLAPTAENLPSGHATRPGDIIKSRKGKTVEIINTDAEGRLLLADALDYANKFTPQAVIDIATLTGATKFILGYAGAPILGNNEKLADQIREASKATSERVWELPIWDDFRDQMKSSIADLTNSGGKVAGTAAAAAFLENFIGDWPWAHIDIAYVDLEPKGTPYVPKGATGFGVRLLTELLARWRKV
ncbi:MAG: leucyl aminopeptidase [Candidatus Zixiibacteriota bacterium]|nr:MAG: leucyl aminopeptidase [candidate division Zixibacteria bacterium]